MIWFLIAIKIGDFGIVEGRYLNRAECERAIVVEEQKEFVQFAQKYCVESDIPLRARK